MGRCSNPFCDTRAVFDVKGTRTAAYCKQYADDGMVDVYHETCVRSTYTTTPSFNVDGSKKAVYCRQQAEDVIINVRSKCCSHDSLQN